MMDHSLEPALQTLEAEPQAQTIERPEGLTAAAPEAAGHPESSEPLAPEAILDPSEAVPDTDESGHSTEGRERGEDLPPEILAQEIVEVATEYISDIHFEDMNLSPWLLEALHARGYTRPTPVQASAYPHAMEGHDLIVRSKTGTGKTVAFLLPILARVVPGGHKPQALILAPTRELAIQVADEAIELGRAQGIVVETLYGGVGLGSQLDHLRKGVDVVVGTPGRILDHIRRRTLDLSEVRFSVLDEADEMLSMGFLEEVRSILKRLPEDHQTLLFSATVDASIASLIKQFMHEPKELLLSADRRTVDHIQNIIYECSDAWPKARSLLYLLYLESPESAIIFCNTRDDCSFVSSYLNRQGFDAEFMNSDLAQKERERVMGRIKRGELSYLVATDIAARGIDISDLSHVINYSLPEDPDIYLHRVGRTGRIGKLGTALSLVSGRDLNAELSLTRRFKIPFVRKSLPSGEEAARLFLERHLEQLRQVSESTAYEGYIPLVKAMLQSLPEEESLRLLATALRLFFSRVRVEQAQAGDQTAPSRDEDRLPRRSDSHSDGDRGGRRDDRGSRRDDRGPRRDERGSRRDDRGPRRSEERPERRSEERPDSRRDRPSDDRRPRRGGEEQSLPPSSETKPAQTPQEPMTSAPPVPLSDAAHEDRQDSRPRSSRDGHARAAQDGQDRDRRDRDGRDRDRRDRDGRDRDSRDRDSRDRDSRDRDSRDRRSRDRRDSRPGFSDPSAQEVTPISLDDVTCMEDLIDHIEPLSDAGAPSRVDTWAEPTVSRTVESDQETTGAGAPEGSADANTRDDDPMSATGELGDGSVERSEPDPLGSSAQGRPAPRDRGPRDRQGRRPRGQNEPGADASPAPAPSQGQEARRGDSQRNRPRRIRLDREQWGVEADVADLIESIEQEDAAGGTTAEFSAPPRDDREGRPGRSRDRRGRDRRERDGAPRESESAEASAKDAPLSAAPLAPAGESAPPVARELPMPDLLNPLAAFAALNAIDLEDLDDEDEDFSDDDELSGGSEVEGATEPQPGAPRPPIQARRDNRGRRDGRHGGGRRQGRGGRRDGRSAGRGRSHDGRSGDGNRRQS